MTRDKAPQTESVPASYHPMAAFLSYLVPGLGQIYQGRVAKGLLFLICLYVMFFYGLSLGHCSNVYLPDLSAESNPWDLPPLLADLWNRPQFLGQFWIGVAAWPAVHQYLTYDKQAEEGTLFGPFMRLPYESRSNTPGGSDPKDRYEARRFLKPAEALNDWQGKTLNELQTEGDRTWDLGWVFTVIAGVLNILVIYDALAGPAFVATGPAASEAKPS
jgi:Family of unknown function (DUF6677)